MPALWILVPIAVVIVAAVIALPLWLTRRRRRDDHDLASAERYLEQIGTSRQDAAPGRPASPKREAGVPAGQAAPRGRHAAPEIYPERPAEDFVARTGRHG